MEAAWDGLEAVQQGELTGKAVIYPHVRGLPLTPLSELSDAEPEAASQLDETGAWTKDAEAALLDQHVRGCPPADAERCPRLTGKVALVTGAAQGLGEALAERLAEEGCDVCIGDINLEGARETADRIANATQQRGLAVEMDVTDEGSVASAMAECVEALGGLDIVVSNAGILIAGATPEFDVDDWRAVMEVNLVGYFIVAKQAATIMLERGTKGAIIQINSKSGRKGSFKNSAYASSKFGGIGLTQSLALEFAEQGIRVNSVCPGNLLDSPLWVDSLYGQYAERWSITEEEVRQKYVDQVPMKRGCTYDDVGNAVVFLASGQASYMTGQAINVTGGQVMW
jgi:sorbitol-6-phosphate 2-dehydrogenase